MSIAVSAIVRPSAALRRLHHAYCLAVIASAWAGDGAWRSALCVLSGLAGLYALRGARTPCRIDISGVGQVRLTVYVGHEPGNEPGNALSNELNNELSNEHGNAFHNQNRRVAGRGGAGAVADADAPAPAAPWRLLAGSTLWPGLLLLRLARAGGPATVLTVLPATVAPGAFRRLALACRTLAARGGADGGKQ